MSALPFLGKLRVRVYYTVLNKISSHMTGTIVNNQFHKKIKATDSIFEQVHKINEEADNNSKKIRISLNAKARMNIGNFSRGGRNRVLTKAEFGYRLIYWNRVPALVNSKREAYPKKIWDYKRGTCP